MGKLTFRNLKMSNSRGFVPSPAPLSCGKPLIGALRCPNSKDQSICDKKANNSATLNVGKKNNNLSNLPFSPITGHNMSIEINHQKCSQ